MRASAGIAIIGIILAGEADLLDLVLPMAFADFGADPGLLLQLGGAICAGVWINRHQPYDHDRDRPTMVAELRPMVLGGPDYPDAELWDRMGYWMRQQARAVDAQRNSPEHVASALGAEGDPGR